MTSTIDHCFSEVTQPLIRQSEFPPSVCSCRIGRYTAYTHQYKQSSNQYRTHSSTY